MRDRARRQRSPANPSSSACGVPDGAAVVDARPAYTPLAGHCEVSLDPPCALTAGLAGALVRGGLHADAEVGEVCGGLARLVPFETELIGGAAGVGSDGAPDYAGLLVLRRAGAWGYAWADAAHATE